MNPTSPSSGSASPAPMPARTGAAVWRGSNGDSAKGAGAREASSTAGNKQVAGKGTAAALPHVVQRMDDSDPRRANRQTLEDIQNGATGIAIVFQDAPNAFGFGLPATAEALTVALADVPLARTHVRLDLHPHSRASVDWLVRILSERKIDPSRLDVSFGIDPAATFAGTGRLRMSIEAMLESMPQSLAQFFALGVPGILLEADGRVFHNAGATAEQELGIMLASAKTYLRMFEKARQPVLYAAAHIGFALSVDQAHARSAAKFAALRSLWSRLLASYSVPDMPAVVHAETSYRMLTAGDPESNILRNAVACFSALRAGANTISVIPHTQLQGLPDARARRIARNTPLIFQQEGNTFLAGDASDSDIAALAVPMADAAWSEYERIEAEGGVLRSVHDGKIQQRIEEARETAAKFLRKGKPPIIGTTLYADGPGPDLASLPVRAEVVAPEGTIFCEQLPTIRLDELLEAAG
ncbi:methylmalonyl-CoA mutase family protein [Mesorhizobium sp. Z1-4]|uniref:methylmalonyl-CoA mutase family protein n=1 Tax=Mesorhizobium sp. Z1-4 TaxID=2448478 RepID=UPI001FDF0C26|nr:methylmalonyl-CoA mutase family protein [Mesorhizobium sp. Z1-4]